jgi:nucleoside-diphosphate-sugar epimerase
VDKAAALLGFTATIPLLDGLRSVVEWRMAQRTSTV